MTESAAVRRHRPALVDLSTEAELRAPRSREKKRAQVGGDGYTLVAGSGKAPKKLEIHRLVEEYDTRGLRAYLKAHPTEVDARNADGDAPSHVIAAKGAVLVAEVLDEFGPNHLASDRRGLLPGHLAAEKHPKTAQFLLERALAVETREGHWHSKKAIGEKVAGLIGQSAEKIDRAAAELCGIPITELNAPGEVVKNRTHLESVKGTVLDLKSEGWWQDKFVPQRVRALLRSAAIAPEEMRPALVQEIGVQLDLLRTIRRVMQTKKCPRENIREMAMRLEARQIMGRIRTSAPGEESTLALGWTGHAIYAGMRVVPANEAAGHPQDTLLFRIDNLGAGITKGHEKEGTLVYSRALHIPMEYLGKTEGARAFKTFLKDLLLIKAAPEGNEDDFYSRVARFKSEVKTAAGADLVESDYLAHERSLPKQIAGNCVVANTFPGLTARLGDATFEWFRNFERDLARELVHEHADTNKLIDEECKERDQRELGGVIDRDGPWADQLKAIIEGGRETYDPSNLAKNITAEQLKKVIDGGDDAALGLLLAHGANASIQGANDATPLHWAAAIGNVVMVRALLDRGAPVNAMDDKGDTPLHLAVQGGSHAVVALLLERKADADRENKAGVTPRGALDKQLDQTLLIARSLGRGVGGLGGERTRLRSIGP